MFQTLILWLFLTLPHNAFAQLDNEKLEIYSHAYDVAIINQLSPRAFIRVINCESGANPRAVGDHGLAKNIVQYHEQTFNADALKFGVTADYSDWKDHLALAGKAFANGDTKKWVCANGLF